MLFEPRPPLARPYLALALGALALPPATWGVAALVFPDDPVGLLRVQLLAASVVVAVPLAVVGILGYRRHAPRSWRRRAVVVAVALALLPAALVAAVALREAF